jgi:two-component system, sensor histidine kinase and response regulator
MSGDAPPKILLADDDPIVIRILMNALHGANALFVAGDGVKAVAMAREIRPDLVILDAAMPEMDGFDACKALKAGPLTADSAVVFLTARNDIASETRALELGAVDFIHKPINPTLVQARVRTHLSVKRQTDQLRRLSDDLRASNAELEQFAYAVSHDLREPLRTIGTHISIIDECYGDRFDSDARASMDFVKDGAQRMNAMIRDLLEYSKIGHGERKPEDAPLNTLVAAALDNLSARIAETGARVEVSRELPAVHGHAGDLVRLFQNLIGNAIKYHAPDRAPVVAVTARREGAACAVTVADNGIGIDPKHFDRIFGVFQRLHGRGAYEGTGIGLALCRKIAASHGGRLEVASTPGQGSAFTAFLPASSRPNDAGPADAFPASTRGADAPEAA